MKSKLYRLDEFKFDKLKKVTTQQVGINDI